MALQPVLKRIIDDIPPNPNSVSPSEKEEEKEEREDPLRLMEHPRLGSMFWKNVIKDVRKHGSRKVSGAQAQIISFSKTQPG